MHARGYPGSTESRTLLFLWHRISGADKSVQQHAETAYLRNGQSNHEQRRGKARQQFLVRGRFLQEVESDDEDEDDEPALDTFWVDQADLLSTIAVEDVEEALETRHDAVVAGLRPAKKARK